MRYMSRRKISACWHFGIIGRSHLLHIISVPYIMFSGPTFLDVSTHPLFSNACLCNGDEMAIIN